MAREGEVSRRLEHYNCGCGEAKRVKAIDKDERERTMAKGVQSGFVVPRHPQG